MSDTYNLGGYRWRKGNIYIKVWWVFYKCIGRGHRTFVQGVHIVDEAAQEPVRKGPVMKINKKAAKKAKKKIKARKLREECIGQGICPTCAVDMHRTDSGDTGIDYTCPECSKTFIDWWI